jgi:hypothetical protein
VDEQKGTDKCSEYQAEWQFAALRLPTEGIADELVCFGGSKTIRDSVNPEPFGMEKIRLPWSLPLEKK